MGKETNKSLNQGWRSTSNPRIKRRYDGALYARFSKYGVRIEQRLHETTMVAAEKALSLIDEALRGGATKDDIRRVFDKSVKQMPTQAILISELWQKFFEYRIEGDAKKKLKPWREKTRLAYGFYWTRFFEPFYGDQLPDDIEKMWPEFIKASQKISKRGKDLGFEHHVKYFGTFCTWLHETGILSKKPQIYDPNWVSKDSDEDEEHGIVFSPEEIHGITEAPAAGPFRTYVRMLAFMGMRSSEVSQLRKDRLDLKKRVIRLRAVDVKTGSKTGKGRSVPIHAAAWPDLMAQHEASGSSPYLFPNRVDSSRPMDTTGFKNSFNKLLEHLNIPDGWPHCLRHTYATRAFSNPKMNPVLVCRYLGMSMQTAERRYIHFTEEHLALVSDQFSYEKPLKSSAPGTMLGLEAEL